MALDPKLLAGLDQEHSQASAQHSKISDVGKMLDATRREMDALAAMGDAVTPADVIAGAGKLVAAGADPKALSAMMAGDPASGLPPMPSGGEALAAWVKQQDQFVQQKEQQFQPVVAQTRHQMGVSALTLLAAHHHDEHGSGGPATGLATSPAPAPNSLVPPPAPGAQ
jgi:hypothetical protein